jgi:hypothetical protein
MPDIKYEVVVDYGVGKMPQLPAATAAATQMGGALKEAKGHAKGLAAAGSELGSIFMDAGGAMASAFTGAVEQAGALVKSLAMAAGAVGVAAITYGVVHLNAELEQTQISFAAIFNANGISSSFVEGMRTSAEQIEKMKKDVKQLPGDFGQLAAIMQQITPVAAQGGQGADKIREMAEKGMLVGSILGIDQAMTARELAMLLSGQHSARNLLGTRLGYTGEKGKKLSTESASERFKDVSASFDKFEAAREAFSHTWVSTYTTFKDDVKYSLLGPATSPLFESVKKTMVDVHGWFERNQSAVSIFVGRLGDGLAEAWQRGSAIFVEWLPAVQTFAHDAYNDIAAIWKSVRPEVEAIGAIIKASLGDGTMLKHLEGVLKAYAVIKLGGGALSLFGGLGGLGSALGTGSAAAGEAGLGIAGAFAAAPELALAGAAIGAAFLAASGELSALHDPNSQYHTQAVDAADELSTAMSVTAQNITNAGNALANKLDPEGSNEGFGVKLTQWLARNINPPMHTGIGDDVHGAGMLWDDDDAVDAAERRKNDIARYKFHNSLAGDIAPAWGDKHTDDPIDFTHSAGKGLPKDEVNKKPPVPGPTTINNYFTISSNHDPSRIARDVVSIIAETRAHPKESRHAFNPSSRT